MPVLEGTEVILSFEKDGISGEAGCNSYPALAKVGDDSFSIEVHSLFHRSHRLLIDDDKPT